MITKRDQTILNFLEDFHIATTHQIHRVFFTDVSYRYVAKRLEYLATEGHIKRTKSTIDNCFAYYVTKKPIQIHHDIIRSELFSHLNSKYQVLQWENEYPFQNIRADAFCYVNDHGIVFPCFIEVHLSNKFDFEKYLLLSQQNDLKAVFGLNPRVIIVTDRDILIPKSGSIKFKVVGLDMSGLDSLFR